MLNQTINGYTIKRKLGEGGMAEVWYAENKIGKPAAIKMLKAKFCADETVVERFQNEAKVMVKLAHPYIRQVYDYVMLDNQPCIIMEYLEGDDLKARLNNGERFENNRLHSWWNQLVDALNYTHQQGVIHRDIKPSNIFIDKYDNVKLLDFGIAKVEEYGGHTQTGVAMGTRIYMSPEQVKDPKRVKAATDTYSLAVTFVHLLTGKAPYDTTTSSDFDIQLSIVSRPLNLNGLSNEWRNFLKPYLEKDATKRPALKHFMSQPARQSVSSLNNNDIAYSIPSDEETYLEAMGIDYSAQTSSKQTHKDVVFNVKGVSFLMKFIEGGAFEMGATPELAKDAASDERPVHDVYVNSFYMGETLVTQALWEAVMNHNPSCFVGENNPVENVSWFDCRTFIEKLNYITGKKFRMPTEAEWEYAARGGLYSTMTIYAGNDNINEVAWFVGNSESKPHPVKQKGANSLNLFDLCGNVAEWCNDLYGMYSNNAEKNPIGSTKGYFRVVRGGCWNSFEKSCRVSNRSSNTPESKRDYIGFRLVLTP